MMGVIHYPACYYFTNKDFDKKVKSHQSAAVFKNHRSCSQSGSQLVTKNASVKTNPLKCDVNMGYIEGFLLIIVPHKTQSSNQSYIKTVAGFFF